MEHGTEVGEVLADGLVVAFASPSFEDEWACVAFGAELADDAGDVGLSGPERGVGAPLLSGRGGWDVVLEVDVPDALAEGGDGADGVSGSVCDEVSGVEIDTYGVAAEIVEEAVERLGGFGAGFGQYGDAVVGDGVGESSDAVEQGGVERVGGVFGYGSEVQGQLVQA